MNVPIGTHLVHPVHGPTVLIDVTTRTVGEEEREYAVLEHVENDLTLHMPVETLDEHDLRPAMKETRAEEVLEVLAAPNEGTELSWRRMRSRNQSKMTSGEPEALAEVVRDLAGKRDENGRLSPSERTMLRRAKARLIAELDIALDGDAETAVDDIILIEDDEDDDDTTKAA